LQKNLLTAVLKWWLLQLRETEAFCFCKLIKSNNNFAQNVYGAQSQLQMLYRLAALMGEQNQSTLE